MLLAFGSRPATAQEEPTFTNPLYVGEDPYLTRGDDRHYYSATGSTGRSGSISVFKSTGLTDQGTRQRVYSAAKEGRFTSGLWAPEIHQIDGQWYIYTCADDGDNANHRAIVLKADTDNPQGEYRFAAELMTPAWAIDATVFKAASGKLYCLWSGWPAGEPADSTQHIFISAMKSPTELEGPAIDISGTMHPWECVERPAGLNEAPQVLERDGRTFVIYSASGSWTADYCLGMLECHSPDLLSAANWTKRDKPVFSRMGNVYGPGHCCFVKSPDGSEDWMLYHSSIDPEGSWNRRVSLKLFTWNAAGEPVLGAPALWGKEVRVPAGEPIDAGVN